MSQLSANITSAVRDHFNAEVGIRMRETRKAKGYNLEALVKETGLTRATIGHAEAGQGISLIALALVADALDVTLDDLVPISSLERPWERTG